MIEDSTEEAIRVKLEVLVSSSAVQDRRRAAKALAKLQTEHVIELLVRLAADEDDETGSIAANAVKVCGDAAKHPILNLLDDPLIAPVGRARVGRLLAEIGDRRSGVSCLDGMPDIVWCEVAMGEFVMGGDSDAYWAANRLKFNLNYPFWIAKYPVTYAQYEVFVNAGGYQEQCYWTESGWADKADRIEPFLWNDPVWHIANHPIVGVSWYEAYAYTQWLNGQSRSKPAGMPNDYMIRLPRECEWEKAARYPDGRLFPWGNDWDARRLNSSRDICRTSAVGIFSGGTSPNGVHDLSGNVGEWCLTAWRDKYETPKEEDNISAGEAWRVARGGAWYTEDSFCRAAARDWSNPTSRNNYRGFRLVWSVPS